MTPDHQEALSTRYNVARIVRLTSGAFALFSHQRPSGMDLLAIGTLAEIEPLIPSAEQCRYVIPAAPPKAQAKLTEIDLDDLLGL
jgi:hypothetical protein